MPKAPAFSAEDEKTTIESGWEEDGSTTVEQGEVADKIRAFQPDPARSRNGNSHGNAAPGRAGNGVPSSVGNITSTGNSVVDEPTVDDQRASAAIAMMTPPSLAGARLVVTQGNDTGQQLEIVPGKTYTIGRAIENDFVLTDIAVSRKHFDLRQEAGAWILADRGSGNGTLVNGNLEDQPFVLANGDLIEIGNTSFRFDQVGAPPRPARPAPVAGQYELEEEEPSTVAGKPFRPGDAAVPAQPPASRLRPKTAPPPAPLARPRSSAPPPAYPANARAAGAPQAGLPGLPPQMSRPARPSDPPKLPPPQPMPPPPRPQPQAMQPQPRAHPASQPPQMQPPQMQPPHMQPPHMLPPHMQPPHMQPPHMQPPHMQPPQMQPPQLGMMNAPHQPLQPGTTLPMPQMQMRPSPMGPHAPAMLGGDGLVPRPSPLPSTIPGQGPPPPVHSQLPYSYPSISEIHKRALVVGNGTPRDATSTSLVQPTPFGVAPTVAAPSAEPLPRISRRTKLLLAGAGLALLAAVATIVIMKGAGSKPAEAPSENSGNVLESGSDGAESAADPTSSEAAKPEAAKPEAAKPEAAKPEAARPEAARPETANPDSARPEAARPETAPGPTTVAVDSARPEAANPDSARPEKTPKKDPKKDPRKTQKPTAQKPATRRSVATATRPDTSAVRNRAIALYRQKKFSEAANVLSQFASTISGTEASDLRTASSVYRQLGTAYNRGMSPGANAIEAYNELRRALNLDSGSAGGEFTTEIRTKLAQIAPKAGMLFYVRKDYGQAFQAVRMAEANGVSNGDTKLVRDKLEQTAKEIYDTAAREINSNPDAAKQKLRQIRGMVDGKSPTLAKANAMLNAS